VHHLDHEPRALNYGIQQRYWTLWRLLYEEQGLFGKKEHRGKRPVEEALGVSLLILDEIQQRQQTPWEGRIWENILDERYANELRTILIANLAVEEARGFFGEKLYDRLREVGGIVELTWASFRKGL